MVLMLLSVNMLAKIKIVLLLPHNAKLLVLRWDKSFLNNTAYKCDAKKYEF